MSTIINSNIRLINRKELSLMGELEIFAIRIVQLRESMGITQREFCRRIGTISQQTLSNYERRNMKPPLDTVKIIAEKFNVSIDWLCGLSDDMELNHNSIRTYADIINECEKKTDPHSSIKKIITKFNDSMMTFAKESEHMQSLLENGMIDQELYDLWLEKTLKKYDIPIVE